MVCNAYLQKYNLFLLFLSYNVKHPLNLLHHSNRMYVCVQSVILSHGFASENYFVRSWLTNCSPFTFPQPKNHSWAMHAHLATVCLCSSHSESRTQEACVHTDKTNFVSPKCIRDCCKAIWYCLTLFKHVTIIMVQPLNCVCQLPICAIVFRDERPGGNRRELTPQLVYLMTLSLPCPAEHP